LGSRGSRGDKGFRGNVGVERHERPEEAEFPFARQLRWDKKDEKAFLMKNFN